MPSATIKMVEKLQSYFSICRQPCVSDRLSVEHRHAAALASYHTNGDDSLAVLRLITSPLIFLRMAATWRFIINRAYALSASHAIQKIAVPRRRTCSSAAEGAGVRVLDKKTRAAVLDVGGEAAEEEQAILDRYHAP